MPPAARQFSILVVDDDEKVVDEMSTFFRMQGYSVDGETNPRRVANRVVNKQYDICLVDISMPEYSGGHVVVDIGTYSPTSKVIVMSALREIEPVLDCIRQGAVDFIPKPVRPSAVKQRVEVNLRRPRFELSTEGLRDNLIESLWSNIEHGRAAERGRRLEQLLQHLIESVPNFRGVRSRRKKPGQEIDLDFMNNPRPEELFWVECGAQFLVECKNWSDRSGAVEAGTLRDFEGKVARNERCKTAFFVSYSGFTSGFQDALATRKDMGSIIVPIDRNGLRRLVESPDRKAVFEEIIRAALD